jgi:hypothetical protein
VCEPLSCELRLAPAQTREHLRAVIVSAFYVLAMANLHTYVHTMAVTAPAQMGVLAGANAHIHAHTHAHAPHPTQHQCTHNYTYTPGMRIQMHAEGGAGLCAITAIPRPGGG